MPQRHQVSGNPEHNCDPTYHQTRTQVGVMRQDQRGRPLNQVYGDHTQESELGRGVGRGEGLT